MKSTTATWLLAALAASTTALAQKASPTKPIQEPSSRPRLNVITVQGCFDSPGELIFNSTLDFNSKSSCVQDICFVLGYEVAGTTGGNQCFCGHKYPPKKSKVADSRCDVGCSGYDIEACGGEDTWTIYNTGKSIAVDTSGEPQRQKGGQGTSPDAAKTTQVTESTVVVTATAEPPAQGANVGAIAGGVVVGVVAVAGSVLGIFIYMRRKRNKKIEEEHRRNAAVNSFMSGKTASSAGSITDARMDPVMAQRRLSDGSIADNQDYSRKILRVTNA